MEWKKYLLDEPNDFHREDYYLAQIAAEIRRGNVKNKTAVTLESALIPFVSKKKRRAGKDDGAEQFFTRLLKMGSRKK